MEICIPTKVNEMSDMDPRAPKYFVKVYGSERWGNRPKFSHTFATFIEQQVQPDESVVRRTLTISWLPLAGEIHPLGPAEAGRNYSLQETLTWLDQAGSKIRWESPETEIQPGLFDSAVTRIQELERGLLRYVMIDSLQSRPHEASNCIHAVTDLPMVLEALGMAYTGVLYGIQASRFVYQYLWPFYLVRLQVPQEHERLVDAVQRAQVCATVVQNSLVDTLKDLVGQSEALLCEENITAR
jgi:hypothetical protein